MFKLSVKCIIWSSICLVVCALVAVWFFKNHILYTSQNLSQPNAYITTSLKSTPINQFYVQDNTLYFAEECGKNTVIRCVKNNWVSTFAKIPSKCERFIIVDDKMLIVQIKDSIYLFNVSDGILTELWSGSCVGFYQNQLFFTDSTALYVADIAESKQRKIVSFDELLDYNNDGIVYTSQGDIYRLIYERPNAPELIVKGTIPWPNDKTVWLIDFTYLYTSDYALRASSHCLDMYFYETGEIRRIYEADVEGMVLMSVTASENELYVSRQWVDIGLWTLINNNVNGTYQYDIQADTWVKIDNDTFPILLQFDEQFLYGFGSYSFPLFDPFKRFKLS